MPDQNQNQTDNNSPVVSPTVAPVVDEPADVAEPAMPAEEETKPANVVSGPTDIVMTEVITKINDAHNILIALLANPTVDDLSAAIGLSLYLDRINKRAVAIYSGETPNAMEFLNPADTLKNSTDTLQDFVISLNKDKADHLRYKIEGDFVKIYITPYKSRIAEEDLEFTYGDFNVDLAIALDVSGETDLDNALREHGRVMHDATIINISTNVPGDFGTIEWSDPGSSSVSEMVARLLYGMDDEAIVEKNEATALLTGIIAATNRFSDSNTTPETLQLASRLMASGADQKLIVENITSDLKDKILGSLDSSGGAEETKAPAETVAPAVETTAPITETVAPVIETTAPTAETAVPVTETVAPETTAETSAPETPAETTAPETAAPVVETTAPVTEAEATVAPTEDNKIPEESKPSEESTSGGFMTETSGFSLPPVLNSADSLSSSADNTGVSAKTETVVSPTAEFASEVNGDPGKYGQMLQDALAELGTDSAAQTTPETPAPVTDGSITPVPVATPTDNAANPAVAAPAPDINNPAASIAPPVASTPEINGVPEINYMPMPGDEILPPPVAPPIDNMGALPPVNVVPPAPAMPDAMPSVVTPQEPQTTSPSAFKIPGA